MNRYPAYPETPIALEEEILSKWRDEGTFARSLEQTEGAPEFVFYEGPPTANGRPGIHHVISRTIKDSVCRFQTMCGRHVTRIAGWDTHGLPVEIEAERRLGISGKREIEAVGVARFNEVCRESVFTYKEDWENLSERIGYWLDYSRPYVTFTADYIESVWSILKRLSEKELIYRGFKSVPYCPRCGTVLSSHEVAQGYEDVEDPSIYFLAPFLDADGADDADGRSFLVWTTTPWTLPSNVALALHPDLTYAEVEHDGRRLVLAEARVEALFGEAAPVVRRYGAGELEGQRYLRPFDLIPASADENAWRVVLERFVTAEDGTGIVHLAPAFGADDYDAGQRHGLPMFRPVDDAGRFLSELPLVGGQFVKEADPSLVEDLRRRGLLFRYGLETHSYPHCWRCGSPLLYMARHSWFLRTTAVKDRMVALNAGVDWHPPETGSKRFGEWLEGNIDWAISRERYWGTPLPVWVCSAEDTHVEVIGSFAALTSRAGPLPDGFDPHKPYIDELTWSCAQCDGTMCRTPEVIDVWFDSGAMPYAQWHCPFENVDRFERHYPADFICEAIDQTRGWFYSLLAIATMLRDDAPYRAVVVNDLILDAQGQKMSKSKGNVVDPWDAVSRFGADAIRWYFLTVSQPWMPKRFDPDALSESWRRVFDNTLANTYRFFVLYANLEGWSPSDADPRPEQRGVLDRWLLGRTAALSTQVAADLAAYELTRAARAIGEFIVDDLSNWYVRRSRDRFWGSADQADTRAAFRTLNDVLVTLARLLAPMTPFTADWLHRALTGSSAHLARYPGVDGVMGWTSSEEIERGMTSVRTLARLGRAARGRARVRVRQPLGVMHAVVPNGTAVSEELLDVLRDEMNVKEVRFLHAAEELVTLRAQPNFSVLGKRLGGRTQEAAQRIRTLGPAELAAFRRGGPLEIEVGGERIDIGSDEIVIVEEARGELVVETADGYTVALDVAIDDALRLEGLARELVHCVQRLRRESGFDVADRIRVEIFGDAEVCAAVASHEAYIAGETLAVTLDASADAPPSRPGLHEVDVEGRIVHISVTRE